MGEAAVEFEQVDISHFDSRKEEVSAALARAAKSIGFFYVTGMVAHRRSGSRCCVWGKGLTLRSYTLRTLIVIGRNSSGDALCRTRHIPGAD